MKVKLLFKSFLLTALLISAFMVVSRSQQIIDWWILRDYTPSAAIEALATNSGMNDLGRKVFYVYDPQLLTKQEFAEKCSVGREINVLGCYVSNQYIYVYNVADERLEGIEEVTAAHEMLHAAYDRLSLKEQEMINEALLEVYSKLDDERIKETVESYRSRDESIVVEELHSIFGTELRTLPQILKNHYSKYFTNREKVVSLAEGYAEEFTKREKEIQDYDDRLADLQGGIAQVQASVTLQSQALSQERQLIEGLRSDAAAFNEAVREYNAKVGVYNNDVTDLEALIKEYNVVVAERNTIALEERELVEAIDTRVNKISLPDL